MRKGREMDDDLGALCGRAITGVAVEVSGAVAGIGSVDLDRCVVKLLGVHRGHHVQSGLGGGIGQRRKLPEDLAHGRQCGVTRCPATVLNRAEDPGVVDQDVEPSVLGVDPFRGATDCGLVGHVESYESGIDVVLS